MPLQVSGMKKVKIKYSGRSWTIESKGYGTVHSATKTTGGLVDFHISFDPPIELVPGQTIEIKPLN